MAINVTAALSRKLAAVLFLILTLGMFGPPSDARANAGWKDLKGYSECGGFATNGKLQPGCDYAKATKVGRALGTCPKGSFFDLGTWSCYSCPTGYNRNAKDIAGEEACDKPIAPRRSTAKFMGKKECPPGAFIDPRNGGECWTCPAGFGRTAAKVDAWNACGMIGKKATNATFAGRSCPEGSFTDPRNGGECWTCPEGYSRTASAVTGGSACEKVLDFSPATKEAALTCEKGQIFDLIDGGSCWRCPDEMRRTLDSVKSPKACERESFKWVTPARTLPGIFGLGEGAEEMVAELIAERTEIDAAIARAAKKANRNVTALSNETWKVIDETPWDSTVLNGLMFEKVVDAIERPAAKRSDAEKKMLASLAQYIQWDRQFLASQAKQVHAMWTKTAAQLLADRGKGNLIGLYGGVITPPDFTDIVHASMASASGLGLLVGSHLSGFMIGKFAVIAPYAAQAAEKSAGAAAGAFITTTGSGTGSVMSAAAGPVTVAISVIIISAMEIDKFYKVADAEKEVDLAVRLAAKPVDLGLLLQQKGGGEQFAYHWATLTGGTTKPSATFKARLAAYAAGKPYGAGGSGLDLSGVKIVTGTTGTITNDPTNPTVAMQTLPTTVVNTNTGEKTATLPEAPEASKALTTAYIQSNTQNADTMRFELSGMPGLCISKLHKHSAGMALRECDDKGTIWIKLNAQTKMLQFAQRYCIVAEGARPANNARVLITECQKTGVAKQWQATKEGLVNIVGTQFCMSALGTPAMDAPIVVQKCDPKQPNQIWRPWSATN